MKTRKLNQSHLNSSKTDNYKNQNVDANIPYYFVGCGICSQQRFISD